MLENQAHAQRVLLSSDAMRYFIGKAVSVAERPALLDLVLAKARATYPTEDGWVVINLIRMEQVLEEIDAHNDALVKDDEIVLPDDAVLPTKAGSLAEAIVTKNVVAAYELISHRPMVALADAVADLDALYKMRKGEHAVVSQLLTEASTTLSLEDIEHMITSLTSVLDGTYTDEESAVKMAIMKAVAQRV